MTTPPNTTTTPPPPSETLCRAATSTTGGHILDAVRQPRPVRTAAITMAAVGGLLLAGALPWLVNAYLISLAATALIMVVLAWSTQLLAGTAGLPSLGQAAYLGVGAYTAATLAQSVTASGPVQLLAATTAGATAAAVTGLLAVRARGTTFLMATFAIGELGHAAANQWAPGASEGAHTPPVQPLPGLPALTLDGWAYLYALTVVTVFGVAVTLLGRTRFVLALRAAAAHEDRARASGHHTGALFWVAYTIAGAVAGAAGSLTVAVHHYVSPADLSFGVSALALAAATIGMGSLAGTAAAAIGLVAARDWAGGILGGYGTTALGVALVAVAFLPRHRPFPFRTGLRGR